jgi:hypothetical protein
VAAFVNDSTVSASVVDLIAKYVYDSLAGRAEARAIFDAAVEKLATDGPAGMRASVDSRAARPWTLTRPRVAYAGVYQNTAMGTMHIDVVDEKITVRIGVLHAVATPFTDPESLRVELAPFQGDAIRFEFADGPRPVALLFGGERFTRQ